MRSTDPTPDQRRRLARHLDELDRWTRRLDLTTVPREAAWERHVEESLRLLSAAQLPPAGRCCDLGSGGGVPGIVVAVMRPDLDITLVEADRRKAGFLVHVCGLLGLGSVTVVDRRAEDLARDPAHGGAYDAVLSRACAPPDRLWRLARPLLRPDGCLWALVSAAAGDEAVERLGEADGAAPAAPEPGLLRVRRSS